MRVGPARGPRSSSGWGRSSWRACSSSRAWSTCSVGRRVSSSVSTGWSRASARSEASSRARRCGLAGVPVGRVGAIRLPEPGSAKVRVELLIARRVQDRIRADSLARIETLGLLGDKIIDVSLGSPGAAILQDGGELRTEEPFDTARLTQQGAALLRNLVELSSRAPDGPLAASPRAPPGPTSPRPCGRSAVSRPRSSGGRASSTGSSTTGSSGRRSRMRARRSGSSGETVRRIDRVLADPRTAELAGEAERTLAEARGRRGTREPDPSRGRGGQGDAPRAHLRRGAHAEGSRGRARAGRDAGRRRRAGRGRDRRAPPGSGRGPGDPPGCDGGGRARAGGRPGPDAGQRPPRAAGRPGAGDGSSGHRAELPRGHRSHRSGRRECWARSPSRAGEASIKQATDALARLGKLAEGLGEDANLGETLADLRQAMADLRAITGRIEAGEGTLGGLIQDPTVYENLAAFLEGAQRSVLLRALIRCRDRPRHPGAGLRPPRAPGPRGHETRVGLPLSGVRLSGGQVVRPLPRLRRVQHHRRGADRHAPRGGGRPPRAVEPRRGARDGARAPGRRVGRGGRPGSLGRGRAGSRPRRRRRAGVAGADRRRSGHRQVDPPPPGLGRAGAGGGAGPLRVGRGVGRAGRSSARSGSGWRRRSSSSWPRRSSRPSRRTWRRASRGRWSSTRSRPCTSATSSRRPAAWARCASAAGG